MKVSLALLCFGILLAPTRADAASCASTQTKASNYTLTEDWTAGSQPCFDMQSGADLNLNGYTISGGSNVAVKCTDNNSTVYSSKANDGDHVDISGGFSIGVQNCNVVKNLVIEGSATAISSMSNADLVFGNVLRDCSTLCIDATMTSNSDRIYDNYIEPAGGDGVRIVGPSSGDGPRVDHNVFRDFDLGIENTGTTKCRIQDSVLADGIGGSTPISVGSGCSITNVACEADTDCSCDLDDLLEATTCLF